MNTPRQQNQNPSQILHQSFLGQTFFTNNIKLRTLTLFETIYSVWLLDKIIKNVYNIITIFNTSEIEITELWLLHQRIMISNELDKKIVQFINILICIYRRRMTKYSKYAPHFYQTLGASIFWRFVNAISLYFHSGYSINNPFNNNIKLNSSNDWTMTFKSTIRYL